MVSPSRRLVIEYDGRRYHDNGAAFERDRRKAEALQAEGWHVIRIREAPMLPLLPNDIVIDPKAEPHVVAALALEAAAKVVGRIPGVAIYAVPEVPRRSAAADAHIADLVRAA